MDTNANDNLDPMFNGLPVLVRLTSREDILCILFQGTDTEEVRLFMERPLRMMTQEIVPEMSEQTQHRATTKTVYSMVQTRFERWIPYTTAAIFPIYPDHILSIAPLADTYINSYMDWADQLYDIGPHSDAAPATSDTPTSPTPDETLDTAQRAYVDYLLHNFKQKGRPH